MMGNLTLSRESEEKSPVSKIFPKLLESGEVKTSSSIRIRFNFGSESLRKQTMSAVQETRHQYYWQCNDKHNAVRAETSPVLVELEFESDL